MIKAHERSMQVVEAMAYNRVRTQLRDVLLE